MNLADFQFAANQSGDSNQAGSKQAQSSRFRDHDVGVSTGDLGGTIEEALTGIDRQLHGNAIAGSAKEVSA